MRFSLGPTIALAGLLGLLTATSSAHAQDVQFQPSRDPAVFKAQLFQFTQLTRRNLRDIQALDPDDSSPLDPLILIRQNAHHAYGFIRAANGNMDRALQYQTYKDPLLVLAQKRVEEAWILARWPADSQHVSRAEYISQSVQKLSQALRLVQQALAMLP